MYSLFERQRKVDIKMEQIRNKESYYPLVHAPQMPAKAEAGIGQSQEAGTQFRSPTWWEVAWYLNPYLLPSRMHIRQLELGLELRNSDMGTHGLAVRTNAFSDCL